MSVTELALSWEVKIKSMAERRGERWGSGGEVGFKMESFKRLWSACVSLCVFLRVLGCKYVCVGVSCPLLQRKRIFVRSTRPGEVMATGRRWSTRLLCCSLLSVVSLVQLEGDTTPGSADEV